MPSWFQTRFVEFSPKVRLLSNEMSELCHFLQPISSASAFNGNNDYLTDRLTFNLIELYSRGKTINVI